MNISLYPVVCHILHKEQKSKQFHFITPLDIQNKVCSSGDAAIKYFIN